MTRATFQQIYAVDPYRNLAAAILALAIRDGRRGGGTDWILSQEPDMCFWCNMAGLDTKCVAETLANRLSSRCN